MNRNCRLHMLADIAACEQVARPSDHGLMLPADSDRIAHKHIC